MDGHRISFFSKLVVTPLSFRETARTVVSSQKLSKYTKEDLTTEFVLQNFAPFAALPPIPKTTSEDTKGASEIQRNIQRNLGMKMVSEMKMVIKLKLKVEKIATKVREETFFGLTGQDI